MHKVTVIYNHPESPEAFEKYYSETHLPIASKIPADKVELTLFSSGPGGSKPEFYRMAELHFASAEALTTAMSSPEGQATAGDLANFASGGAHMLITNTSD